MDTTFSLGNAILKTADSPVHAPETFRDELLHKHLDAASRAAVAQTCRAGLEWMLQEWAETATLRVPVRATSAESPVTLTKRLQVAARQLKQRQSKATALLFQQRGWIPRDDSTWWHIPLTALASISPPSTLTLSLQLHRVPAALLEYAGAAWPALTSLSVGQLRGVEGAVKLPPPSALPALRRVAIGWACASAQEELFLSLAPFLPQLERLTVQEQAALAPRRLWETLFNPSTTSTTLQHLTVPFALSPWFVALLQRYTPRLEELCVTGISNRTVASEQVAPVCSWHTLRYTSNQDYMDAEAWQWLPVPAKGKLHIHAACQPQGTWYKFDEEPRSVDLALPITDLVARKLSSIQWAGYNKVDLHAHNVPAQGRLGALWATLPLLASWFPTSFGLCVCGLPMSQELSAWLAAAAAAGWDQPGLEGSTLAPDVAITPHIPLMSYIHLHNQELDDGLLAQLSECVGFMWRLYVAGVTLTQSPAQGAAPLIDILCIEKPIDLRALLKQAGMINVAWECECVTLCLTPEQVESGEHVRFASELASLRLLTIDKLRICAHDQATREQQPSLLRASFTVLNALPCKPKHIEFDAWKATTDIVSEFHALGDVPALRRYRPSSPSLQFTLWSAEHTAQHGTWPCAQLAQHIPRAVYDSVLVSSYNFSTKELEAFITGAAEQLVSYTHIPPLCIRVTDVHEGWVASVNAQLLKLGRKAQAVYVMSDSDDVG